LAYQNRVNAILARPTCGVEETQEQALHLYITSSAFDLRLTSSANGASIGAARSLWFESPKGFSPVQSMAAWFDLPPEIRNQIYQYAFGELVFQPRQEDMLQHVQSDPTRTPSPSFSSLAVSKQWRAEVIPYLLQSGTFDFTAYPGDPPPSMSTNDCSVIKQAVILETQCFSADWVSQVFDKMTQVQSITIRKLRRLGIAGEDSFDECGWTESFIERVKSNPVKTLLVGYRFDHVHVKDVLQKNWPDRKIFLEGKLWLSESKPPHSVSTEDSKVEQQWLTLTEFSCLSSDVDGSN
jgi:hypothetical protein